MIGLGIFVGDSFMFSFGEGLVNLGSRIFESLLTFNRDFIALFLNLYFIISNDYPSCAEDVELAALFSAGSSAIEFVPFILLFPLEFLELVPKLAKVPLD